MPKPVPQTGDSSSPALWLGLVLLGLLGLAAIGGIAIGVKRRK